MMFLMFVFGPISWVCMILLDMPLELLGWAIIPPLSYSGAYHTRQSKYFNKTIVAWDNPIVDAIYGNEEDGILNGRQYSDWGADWKQIVYWTALRNSTNNLRFGVQPFSFILDPKKIKSVGSMQDNPWNYDTAKPQWFFVSHGLYSCFYAEFMLFGSLRRFYIGWALYPTDVNGVTSYRANGVGFKLQFKKIPCR